MNCEGDIDGRSRAEITWQKVKKNLIEIEKVIIIEEKCCCHHRKIKVQDMTESIAQIPGSGKTIKGGTSSASANSEEGELCELLDGVRVTSPSSSEDSILRKNRNDSGCSYEAENPNSANKKISGSGHSTDSGHGSTDIEEGMIFAYHFMIPSHLCGKFFYFGRTHFMCMHYIVLN